MNDMKPFLNVHVRELDLGDIRNGERYRDWLREDAVYEFTDWHDNARTVKVTAKTSVFGGATWLLYEHIVDGQQPELRYWVARNGDVGMAREVGAISGRVNNKGPLHSGLPALIVQSPLASIVEFNLVEPPSEKE